MKKLEKIIEKSEYEAMLELIQNIDLKDDSFRVIRGSVIELVLLAKNLRKIPNIINNFSQLRNLWLNSNQIVKIEGLDKLDQLKKLSISNNKIKEIEGLKDLVKLEELYLNNNQIVKIEGLEGLSQLIILDLKNNHIKKIECLEGLTQLKELDLGNNLITNLEGLENFSSFRRLDLIGNPLIEKDMKIYKNGIKAVIEHCKKVFFYQNKFKNQFLDYIAPYDEITFEKIAEYFKLDKNEIENEIKKLLKNGNIKGRLLSDRIILREPTSKIAETVYITIPPRTKLTALNCPNCKSPLELMPPCNCEHCGVMIELMK